MLDVILVTATVKMGTTKQTKSAFHVMIIFAVVVIVMQLPVIIAETTL
jgi:hypothetical protein